MAQRMDELRAKNSKATLQYRWVPLRADLGAPEAGDDRRRGRQIRRARRLRLGRHPERAREEPEDGPRRRRAAPRSRSSSRRICSSRPREAIGARARRRWSPCCSKRCCRSSGSCELYLNVIEWGNGVFGAEAAAQRYFGVIGGAAHRRAGGASRRDGAESAPVRAPAGFGATSTAASRRSSRGCRRPRFPEASSPRRGVAQRLECGGSFTRTTHVDHRTRRDADRADAPSERAGRARPRDGPAAPAPARRRARPRAASSDAPAEREAAAELAESAVYKKNKARARSASSTGCTRPTSPTSSKRCRSTSGCTSGTCVRAVARRRHPARGLRRRFASRSSRRWTPRSSSPRPRRSKPTRSPSSRPTCRRR